MKQPAKTDIAVLLLFFNRPETFRQVFAAVKEARPSRLFLYQDGSRGPKDDAGVAACREIASNENIDWECDVQRLYQTRNYGCDPSGFMSQQWAFSLADKVMVLEDDVVPSQSFFPFCKEMLDRYENDERIEMVTGFNVDEVTPDVPYDYFFTSLFSIWGWASWSRVIKERTDKYELMTDDFNRHQLEEILKVRNYRHDFMRMYRDHAESGKAYFESIFWTNMLTNSRLAIMPTRNMINNIGATNDSTHYSALKTMPRRLRRIFTMQRFDVSFPLRHPRYVMEYVPFKEHHYRVLGWGHPWIKVSRSLEELFLNLRYGNFGFITRSLRRRINKWMGKDRHV